MRDNARSASHSATGRKPVSPSTAVAEIMTLVNEGRWDQLESRARALAARQPGSALGWKALGTALMQQEKFGEAVSALTRLVKIVPSDVGGHNNLALALAAVGKSADAESSYQRAIKINPRFGVAHQNLGVLLSRLGRFDEALVHQRLALEIDPLRAELHVCVAAALRDLGRLGEAEACYRRALALQPNAFEAHLYLGLTLADLTRFDEALAHYRQAVALRPDAHAAQLQLGSLLSRLGLDEAEMRACLQRCVELEPENADGWIALGNEFLRTQELDRSRAMFEAAQKLRPLLHKPALTPTPAFSVLMLDTPGAGCTPVEYLSSRSVYDRHFYCVLPTESAHIDLLKSRATVLFNMIADADNGAAILPFALDLVARLGLPTVNHPRQVMDSGREAMALRLAGTPHCRVPRTLRLAATVLSQAASNGVLGELTLPLLVRMTGTHGGDIFEKFDNLGSIAAFVAVHPDADFYVTEYVDYRSADGFFRKYRFICMEGKLLPYHLAIHDHWMVHHFRTDMVNQLWMRQEEEAFLDRPQDFFDEALQRAVLAMATATGLDYCGVDVGIGTDGDVVFFECNATMLVHDEKDGPFVYKNPYIARIKIAFDAMLARIAQSRPLSA